MAKKTYGKISFDRKNNSWVIHEILPQAAIKLKKLFPKVSQTATPPFLIQNSAETAVDLEWFFLRYPFLISKTAKEILTGEADNFRKMVEKSEDIIKPSYKPKKIKGIKDGHKFDNNQLSAADFLSLTQRYLLVDPIGSGKTYSSIAGALKKGNLPAAFVVQTHLTSHFANKIKEITDLRVHIVAGKKPYQLPKADIYIFKYSLLSSWVDIADTGFFKYVMFDEVQELRHGTSTAKGGGAEVFSNNAETVLATTATPIYGYGIEFFNILDIIKKGSLGSKDEFSREWCTNDNKKIIDPKAFGEFLRETRLMLDRTHEKVGINEIPLRIIPETIDYDPELVKSTEDLAKELALKTINGSFTEQGQAARQLDLALRETTGISKAKNVAHFVRMLVDSGEKVLLSGWHREFYHIINQELSDLNPVMYTGSETETKKKRAKDSFIYGDSKVFILSHASGSGLDGLQEVCSKVVIGELAWSEQIHNQIIGRVARRGQKREVFAFILTSNYGSDPIIKDILDIKYQQQHLVFNPDEEITVSNNFENKSRLKELARKYLNNIN